MRRTLLALAAAGALVGAGSASAVAIPVAHTDAELVIRHSKVGCHMWDRGQMRAGTVHAITIYAGHPLSIVNRDAVAHTLVQMSGPASVPATVLPNRGASTTFMLHVPGTYTFQTIEAAHRQLMLDAKDVPDHVLTLKIVVASEFR